MIHNMSDKLHLNAGRPENRGSIPSSSVPDQLWSQPSLLLDVNRRLFPEVQNG